MEEKRTSVFEKRTDLVRSRRRVMGAAIFTGEFDIAQIMVKAGLGIENIGFLSFFVFNNSQTFLKNIENISPV